MEPSGRRGQRCLVTALTAFAALALLAAPSVSHAQSWPDISAAPAKKAGGGSKDAALVIAIEDYTIVSDIPGARANATAWVKWLSKSRGVPRTRIRTLYDGQATELAIPKKAAEVAKLARPGGTVWLVFIGHGAPSKDGKDGLLVGVDARQTADGLYGRSVAQHDVLATLATGRQERTVAVIDACFSGSDSSGKRLAPGLQPLVVATSSAVQSATLLTAGASDEFAGPLPGAARPAFSYLALAALRGWGDQDGDGHVTAAEVASWSQDVLATAVHGRTQTPQASGSGLDAPLATAAEEGPDLSSILDPGAPPARADTHHQRAASSPSRAVRATAEAFAWCFGSTCDAPSVFVAPAINQWGKVEAKMERLLLEASTLCGSQTELVDMPKVDRKTAALRQELQTLRGGGAKPVPAPSATDPVVMLSASTALACAVIVYRKSVDEPFRSEVVFAVLRRQPGLWAVAFFEDSPRKVRQMLERLDPF